MLPASDGTFFESHHTCCAELGGVTPAWQLEATLASDTAAIHAMADANMAAGTVDHGGILPAERSAGLPSMHCEATVASDAAATHAMPDANMAARTVDHGGILPAERSAGTRGQASTNGDTFHDMSGGGATPTEVQ